MSRVCLCFCALALIAAGCDDTNPSSLFQLGQVANKPTVAVLPVFDNTKGDYSWNLSDELSSAIFERLSQRGHVVLVDPAQACAQAKKLTSKDNPFGPDISWMKQTFPKDEFVVFLELVEHQEILNQNRKNPSDPKDCTAHLNMCMRVRVVDLREQTPQVVLQELVRDTHFVPRQFTQENFFQVSWGEATFSISPLGLAHAKFTKELADRIDAYVSLTAQR